MSFSCEQYLGMVQLSSETGRVWRADVSVGMNGEAGVDPRGHLAMFVSMHQSHHNRNRTR